MGKHFFWWQGVVEDRHDEDSADGMKLGRVRVRILGVHSPMYEGTTEEGEGIAPDQLHWAYPMMPITSAGQDGIGTTPMGLLEGSWVFGFSRDGEFSHDLIIMGSYGSFQEEPKNPEFDGFCDPELSGAAVPPRPKGPYPAMLGEESTNRLARNDEPHDILAIKEANREMFLANPIALDGEWAQPEIQYEAEYPFNHVKESESGHIEEWDDTPEKERLHRYHKSGTYSEIYPDGMRTVQVINDDHETIDGVKHIIATGDVVITSFANVKILGLENVDIQAEKIVNIVAGEAINLAAPLINEVSDLHTITTGELIIDTEYTRITAGLVDVVSPLTNFWGSVFVEEHLQAATIGTGFLKAGFIVTGGCSGCC